jgi:hypothetical protein
MTSCNDLGRTKKIFFHLPPAGILREEWRRGGGVLMGRTTLDVF